MCFDIVLIGSGDFNHKSEKLHELVIQIATRQFQMYPENIKWISKGTILASDLFSFHWFSQQNQIQALCSYKHKMFFSTQHHYTWASYYSNLWKCSQELLITVADTWTEADIVQNDYFIFFTDSKQPHVLDKDIFEAVSNDHRKQGVLINTSDNYVISLI